MALLVFFHVILLQVRSGPRPFFAFSDFLQPHESPEHWGHCFAQVVISIWVLLPYRLSLCWNSSKHLVRRLCLHRSLAHIWRSPPGSPGICHIPSTLLSGGVLLAHFSSRGGQWTLRGHPHTWPGLAPFKVVMWRSEDKSGAGWLEEAGAKVGLLSPYSGCSFSLEGVLTSSFWFVSFPPAVLERIFTQFDFSLTLAGVMW